METRGRPGEGDAEGAERMEREKVTRSETKKARGAAERDLETCHHLLKVIAWQTNSLFLLPPLNARLTASWLPWWGGLHIATGGGVVRWDWQWRQLASDCPSVCPSPCVRLGLGRASCLAFTDEVMLLSALVPIYVSGLEFGDDPHISVEIQILFEWVDNFFQITTKQ